MNGPPWMDVLTYIQSKTAWAFNGFLFVKRKNEKFMKGNTNFITIIINLCFLFLLFKHY